MYGSSGSSNGLVVSGGGGGSSCDSDSDSSSDSPRSYRDCRVGIFFIIRMQFWGIVMEMAVAIVEERYVISNVSGVCSWLRSDNSNFVIRIII